MSKLVLFLFLAVCVVAVHMQARFQGDSDDDDVMEDFINALEPILKEKFLENNPRVKVNWKKVWKVAKPIVKEGAKIAAGAAAATIVG